MREKAIYISGPMRGIPQFNFPAFNAAEERWHKAGWHVFNPTAGGFGGGDFATGEGVTEAEVQNWLREDIRDITACEAVALLPGWEDSEGAQFEVAVAYKIGCRFYDAETMTEIVVEQQEEEAA